MMKRNPGREKDPIWEHAIEKKEEKGFVCKHCEKFYTGGATRIKSHLSGKSGGGIRPCPKFVPLHGEEAAYNFAATTSSPNRPYNHNITLWPIIEPFHDEEDANIVTTIRSSPERPDNNDTILQQAPSSSNTRVGNDQVHMLLVKHFILNNIPLETIDKPYFRNLVNSIASLEPQYELPPTYSSLVEESLSNLINEVKQYIQTVTVLESCSIAGCSVKLHVKKRSNGDFDKSDVVGYTLYCPKGVIFLNAHDPSYDPCISKSTFQLFSYAAEKTIIQEAIQIFCDWEFEDFEHDENFYVSSFEYSSKHCFKCKALFCAPIHLLYLFREMHQTCKWVSDLLTEVNYLYQYLTQSQSKCLMMAREEKPLTSKHENPFLELLLVMQHKAQLQSTFLNQSENASILSYIRNQDKFWEDGKELLNAVGPLVRILEVFDTFVPNIGYFFEAMEMAEDCIVDYELNPEKFKELSELFSIIKHGTVAPIHVAAAYLNPDYMFNKLSTSSMDRQKGIDYLNNCMVKSEKENFTEQLKIYSDKDPSLFTETAISKLKVYHPVTWWDEFGHGVPVLRRYAIQLLSQPSNCLSHLHHKDKFEGSDLFQKNVKMMEEFKLFGETILTPIDLSIIGAPMIS